MTNQIIEIECAIIEILLLFENVLMYNLLSDFNTKFLFYMQQVECHGKGIEKDGVSKGKPTEFTIDTKRAGSAPLDVQVCSLVNSGR